MIYLCSSLNHRPCIFCLPSGSPFFSISSSVIALCRSVSSHSHSFVFTHLHILSTCPSPCIFSTYPCVFSKEISCIDGHCNCKWGSGDAKVFNLYYYLAFRVITECVQIETFHAIAPLVDLPTSALFSVCFLVNLQ